MVTHDWFVCITVSMVTTSHATGLEKTLLHAILISMIWINATPQNMRYMEVYLVFACYNYISNCFQYHYTRLNTDDIVNCTRALSSRCTIPGRSGFRRDASPKYAWASTFLSNSSLTSALAGFPWKLKSLEIENSQGKVREKSGNLKT